jgi:hypothetical protein
MGGHNSGRENWPIRAGRGRRRGIRGEQRRPWSRSRGGRFPERRQGGGGRGDEQERPALDPRRSRRRRGRRPRGRGGRGGGGGAGSPEGLHRPPRPLPTYRLYCNYRDQVHADFPRARAAGRHSMRPVSRITTRGSPAARCAQALVVDAEALRGGADWRFGSLLLSPKRDKAS